MSSIPAVSSRAPRENRFARQLAPTAGFDWLARGWRDLVTVPSLSLLYGAAVFAVSLAIVWGLFAFNLDYILLPALSGFLVVGPILAVGLYEKSRRLAEGQPVSLAGMLLVRAASGGQILFVGVLLSLLMMLWLRAAILIYALFFGVRPFPGSEHILPMLVGTTEGWAMLVVGTFIGGLFAAFSFAISVFAIPMLLNQRVDALTAMGTSLALVWNNLPAMLVWGVIVLVLMLVSMATCLVALIVIFPLLGHATWHAYRAMRP